MKERIRLESRSPEDENYLNRIGDENSKRYVLQTNFCYRVGFINDPNIYIYVDPSGGPFIEKGTEIDGNIVKSMSKGDEGIIIEFE